MKDGSMFSVLDGYKEQAFYEEHPSLLLLTPEGSYEATVFSAYVAPAAGDAWQLDFEDDADFSARLDSVAANSVIETGVSPGAEDRVLRLSTCSMNTTTPAWWYTLCCVRERTQARAADAPERPPRPARTNLKNAENSRPKGREFSAFSKHLSAAAGVPVTDFAGQAGNLQKG